LIDPTGEDPLGLHSYQALLDMVKESEGKVRNSKFSNVQFQIALLESMQYQITKPIAKQITDKARGSEKGKINYFSFENFKEQVNKVKQTEFDEIRYTNIFIRASELILRGQADETFAFGQAMVEECNKDHCLIGTFLDKSKPMTKGIRSMLS
jgi:hypothetical protein